ncbi:MAG: Fe-S cluster assembly ATPase SufC [Crenarchaeota archaeon]|nr:Fe-S cluster assembly ATPase SufC [Thermoproteota archaeon]
MALRTIDLHVSVGDKEILHGINIEIHPGELRVIMGPNGSGKTSLAMALMGHSSYKVTKGRIILDGEDITSLPPHERALRGLFLVFQNPVEIPGVRLEEILKLSIKKRLGGKECPDIRERIESEAKMIGLTKEHLERGVNVGFSGGEKKRGEILQAKILRPKYVIMDEPDSGLDVDGIRIVADVIKELVSTGRSVLLITHYPRVLEYVEPDHVYVLYKGRIVAEGGMELVERINREGFKWIEESREEKKD